MKHTFLAASKDTALAKALKTAGLPSVLAQQEGPLRQSRNDQHPMFGFSKKDGLSTLEVGGGNIHGGFELIYGSKGELQGIGVKNYARSGTTYYTGSPKELGAISDRILSAGVGTKDDLGWLCKSADAFGLAKQPYAFVQDNLKDETMKSFMQYVHQGMDKAGLKLFSPHLQKQSPAPSLSQ